jgi:TPR repeat protein
MSNESSDVPRGGSGACGRSPWNRGRHHKSHYDSEHADRRSKQKPQSAPSKGEEALGKNNKPNESEAISKYPLVDGDRREIGDTRNDRRKNHLCIEQQRDRSRSRRGESEVSWHVLPILGSAGILRLEQHLHNSTPTRPNCYSLVALVSALRPEVNDPFQSTILRDGPKMHRMRFFSVLLSGASIAHSDQTELQIPGGGPGSDTTYQIQLCVPANIVERDKFEQPAPGSNMDAFQHAIRHYLRDHSDIDVQYRVKENAFQTFDSAADPRDLMDEVRGETSCPAADYSYVLDVKHVAQNAIQDRSQDRPQSSAPSLSAGDSLYRGWQYEVGSGVRKDPVTAVNLYADAARQGVPDAMYRLALMYREGMGVKPNPAAAVDWFYQAAKRGHAAAQMELGFALITGNGVRQDDSGAFRWLLLAAQAGIPRAQAGVGAMYEAGQGTGQNEFEAAAWFRKAAQQGQVLAMYELGQSLRLGQGVARNEAEAMQWYEKAANGGYASAQAALGLGCLTGSGVARDFPLAAHWLGEAARQGDPYALLNLGTMYENGSGVDRDFGQARALYAQAARGGVPAVAQRARQLAAALPVSSGETPDSSGQSADRDTMIGVGALVVVGATLIALLSRSDSGDTATAPRTDGASPSGSSVGPDLSSGSSSSSTPVPRCHVAPADDPFTAKSGSDFTSPRGATTLVCD